MNGPVATTAATLTLAVLRYRHGWRVFGPHGGWRRFDYRVDTEEAALRLAQQANRTDRVQVLVQAPRGELRPLPT